MEDVTKVVVDEGVVSGRIYGRTLMRATTRAT